MGKIGSTSKLSSLGSIPALNKCEPNAATMAPLSVQSPGRGILIVTPTFSASLTAILLNLELAATPPPITTVFIPVCFAAKTIYACSIPIKSI